MAANTLPHQCATEDQLNTGVGVEHLDFSLTYRGVRQPPDVPECGEVVMEAKSLITTSMPLEKLCSKIGHRKKSNVNIEHLRGNKRYGIPRKCP